MFNQNYHVPVGTIILSALTLVQSGIVITLHEAQGIALKNAFEVRISKQAEIASNWQFWNAVGGYLPNVKYASQYMRLAENYFTSTTELYPAASVPGTVVQKNLTKALQQPIDTAARFQREFPRNMFTHELSANQPIVNGSAFVAIKIGSAAHDAQKYRTEAERQKVIYSVRERYYNAVSAEGRLNSALLYLKFSQESLENARIREQSGVVTITDVLRWEAEVADSKANVSQAESSVELSKLNLLLSMGYDVDTVKISNVNLEQFENFAHACSTMILSTDTIVDIEQNPSWKAVKKMSVLANHQRTLALTNYFPVLSGFYSYQWQSFNELFPERGGTWFLGLALTIPLFSSFTTTSGYYRQKAQAEQQMIESEQSRNTFIVQARSALFDFSSSVEQLEAATVRRELMEKTLTIVDMRYRAGVANQTDLLQVAADTERARVDYIQAVLDCLLAMARFKLSTGTLETSDVQ